MLKKRELQDVSQLFDLIKNPAVFPFVREKANTLDEYFFMTKQSIEAEQNGEMITRTILSNLHQPIGVISLVDITKNCGFLATWIGQPYFGKGYNETAKLSFLHELFNATTIETVFLKIRKTNIRSIKANRKLGFLEKGNESYSSVFNAINIGYTEDALFDLFVITKKNYYRHYPTSDKEIIS